MKSYFWDPIGTGNAIQFGKTFVLGLIIHQYKIRIISFLSYSNCSNKIKWLKFKCHGNKTLLKLPAVWRDNSHENLHM